MFRVMCITIFSFYITFFHWKMECDCIDVERHYNKTLQNVLDRVRNYVIDVQRYIGIKVPGKPRLKNDFINFVEQGFKKIQPPLEMAEKSLAKFVPAVQEKPAKKMKTIFKPSMNAKRMIVAHNYKVEIHTVITADGYILTVHRILPNYHSHSKRTIIMHHGLLGSADDWLILGPGLSLPYLLIDQGYDVWLLNARGNKYSRIHISKYTESFDFWNFSWHEMGIYDLPAAITYINEYTNNTDLHYIGHSMGATVLLVLLSTMPEYNKELKSAIFLAPLAFMQEVQGPLKYFAKFRNSTKHVISLLGGEEFMANKIPEEVVDKFCSGSFQSCHNPLLLLANGGIELMDEDLEANILAHVPAGASTKTMLHYMQLIKSRHFRMFDNGYLMNLEKYKKKKPPDYDLQAITLPICIFSSPSDWLSTTFDITKLLSSLQTANFHHIVRKKDFSHMDFIWSKEAPDLIYYLLMNMIDMSLVRRRFEPVTAII